MSLTARQEYLYILFNEGLENIKEQLNLKDKSRLSGRENKILEITESLLANKRYFIDDVLEEERENLIRFYKPESY